VLERKTEATAPGLQPETAASDEQVKPVAEDSRTRIAQGGARSLPDDVARLSWLADELGIADSTCYRHAALGDLAEFGVFRAGSQYRVSKVKALRRIHGSAPEPASA
jgi:hypothetical protein